MIAQIKNMYKVIKFFCNQLSKYDLMLFGILYFIAFCPDVALYFDRPYFNIYAVVTKCIIATIFILYLILLTAINRSNNLYRKYGDVEYPPQLLFLVSWHGFYFSFNKQNTIPTWRLYLIENKVKGVR